MATFYLNTLLNHSIIVMDYLQSVVILIRIKGMSLWALAVLEVHCGTIASICPSDKKQTEAHLFRTEQNEAHESDSLASSRYVCEYVHKRLRRPAESLLP